MVIFFCVVELGVFFKVVCELGLILLLVSQYISVFEVIFGIILLYWIICKFSLIEVGQGFYVYCVCIVVLVNEVCDVIESLYKELVGELCIVFFSFMVFEYLVFVFDYFICSYFQLCISIYVSDYNVDFMDYSVDLVLWVGKIFGFGDILLVCMGVVLCVFFDYLQVRVVICCFEDLFQYQMLFFILYGLDVVVDFILINCVG